VEFLGASVAWRAIDIVPPERLFDHQQLEIVKTSQQVQVICVYELASTERRMSGNGLRMAEM
jgi:hypothetical protein